LTLNSKYLIIIIIIIIISLNLLRPASWFDVINARARSLIRYQWHWYQRRDALETYQYIDTTARYLHPTQFHSAYVVHLARVYDIILQLHLLFCFTAHCFLVCIYIPLPVILFCFLRLSSPLPIKFYLYKIVITTPIGYKLVTPILKWIGTIYKGLGLHYNLTEYHFHGLTYLDRNPLKSKKYIHDLFFLNVK